MNTPRHQIAIAINATIEQLNDTDDLYEVIAPELPKDEELKYKFNAFFVSKLSGVDLIEQFARVMQPKIAKLANDLDHRLSLPLYAALARHISNEWVSVAVGNKSEESGGFVTQGLALGLNPAFAAPYTGNTTSVVNAILKAEETGQDHYLAGISARDHEVSLVQQGDLTQTGTIIGYGVSADPTVDIDTTVFTEVGTLSDGSKLSIGNAVVQQASEVTLTGDNHVSLTFHPSEFVPPQPTSNSVDQGSGLGTFPGAPIFTTAPRGTTKLQAGSKGQDRSRPVLTARVLRGFEELEKKLLIDDLGHSGSHPELTKGDRDVRTALAFMARTVAWGKKHGKM